VSPQGKWQKSFLRSPQLDKLAVQQAVPPLKK